MSQYKAGDRVELSDKVYCGEGVGYIQKVTPGDRPLMVTNQRPGTDDEFVWGAHVNADEIIRAVPDSDAPMTSEQTQRMSEAEIKELIMYAATSDIRDDVMVIDLMRAIHQLSTDLAAMTERAEKAEGGLDRIERKIDEVHSRLTESSSPKQGAGGGEFCCVHCKRYTMHEPGKLCGLCKGRHPVDWRHP